MNPSINNVVFFNHLRNGDIHLSRGLVRQVVIKIKQINPNIKFYYAHKNDPVLLADQGVIYSAGYWNILHDEYLKSLLLGDTLFLSTWYAAGNRQFLDVYGISFDCLYSLFDDHCKTWFGFSLSDISNDPIDFFPVIDYSKFYISEAKTKMEQLGGCVFVCNGLVRSGQSFNFNLTNPVINLANKYPDINFILTNNEDGEISGIKNIFYSRDIIKKQTGSDLNENSYLSTFCPIIIGRSSGTFSYSLTKDNVSNNNKTIISFSVPGLGEKIGITNTYWISNRLCNLAKYKAVVLSFNIDNAKDAESIIDSHIKRLYFGIL